MTESVEATSIRRATPGQLPTVLLLGNSLLLEGVDYGRIKRLMEHEARIRRFVVENTTYFDWYFGVKRMLADGSRPEFIILCLNPAQLVGSSVRADYSPYYLMELQDFPAIRRAAKFDLTQTADLLFAHYSLFYARRNTLRTFLLNRLDMPYSELLHSLVAHPPSLSEKEELTRIAERRLRDLDGLAASQGSRFGFLLPPGFMAGESELLAAAESSGAKVMAPIHQDALSRDYFADGFHLNPAGAQIFTTAIASELHNWVALQHSAVTSRR